MTRLNLWLGRYTVEMSRLFEDAVNSVDEVAQQEPEHVDTIEIVCEFTMNRFHFFVYK